MVNAHVQFEREVPPRDVRQRQWIARWREARQRGRSSYVLRNGILIHGIVFATCMAFARWFGLFGAQRPQLLSLVVVFCFHAVVFGLFAGFAGWRANEKRFKALIEANHLTNR